MNTTAVTSFITSVLFWSYSGAKDEAFAVLSELLDDGKITEEELIEAVKRIADAALPLDTISDELEKLSDDLIDDVVDAIAEALHDLFTRDADELEAASERKLAAATRLEELADELEAEGHPSRAARKMAKSLRKLDRAEELAAKAEEKRAEEDAE